MTQRGKYFVFGIGFLVGCVLVWTLFLNKPGMDFAPRSQKELKPWYGRVYFEKTTPIVAAGDEVATHFERIRVIDEGSGQLVRLVEVFEKSEQTKNRERVTRRLVMACDAIWVRFKSPEMAHDATVWLKENHFEYEPISDVLFRVKVVSQQGADAVGDAIESYLKHPEWVSYAFPEYVLHYG